VLVGREAELEVVASVLVLVAAGEDERAANLVEQAVVGFDELAAVREADAARSLLGRLRPKRRPTAPRRAVVGWEALTATEQEVVEEVCRGQSNSQVAARLGISRRTVEAHLRSIYLKVGVSSRLALAVERHERAEVAGAR
jgi:DNA-binding CsgD family transcriptional regulator